MNQPTNMVASNPPLWPRKNSLKPLVRPLDTVPWRIWMVNILQVWQSAVTPLFHPPCLLDAGMKEGRQDFNTGLLYPPDHITTWGRRQLLPAPDVMKRLGWDSSRQPQFISIFPLFNFPLMREGRVMWTEVTGSQPPWPLHSPCHYKV